MKPPASIPQARDQGVVGMHAADTAAASDPEVLHRPRDTAQVIRWLRLLGGRPRSAQRRRTVA